MPYRNDINVIKVLGETDTIFDAYNFNNKVENK